MYIYICIYMWYKYMHISYWFQHFFSKVTTTNKTHHLAKPRKTKPGCWTATFFRLLGGTRWPPNASAPQQGISMSPRSSCTSRSSPGVGWKIHEFRPVWPKKPKTARGGFSTQTWCFFFWMVGKTHQNCRFEWDIYYGFPIPFNLAFIHGTLVPLEMRPASPRKGIWGPTSSDESNFSSYEK